MILKKINYYENEGKDNYWRIRDVNLGDINLIVGLNATGKTRLVNIISNLSKILTKKIKPTDGCWTLEFQSLDDKTTYVYNLSIIDKVIVKEEIVQNDKVLLKRATDNGQIWSSSQSKTITINPPKNELVLSIRRDRVEFPFLEDLYRWADNLSGFAFCMSPNEICIPNAPEGFLQSLTTVPFILKEALQQTPQIKETIIKDLCSIGYPVNEVRVTNELLPGLPPGLPFAELQEKDLKCPTKQFQMSQGMFRAFALIVIVEYILEKNKYFTVIIDDLGEGLDYDRATKLTQLLFSKAEGSKMQLLVTSNVRFLINNTNIEYLNILERHGHVVESFNYLNSKEKFEEFKVTGLSAFDFFTGKMYKEGHDNKD